MSNRQSVGVLPGPDAESERQRKAWSADVVINLTIGALLVILSAAILLTLKASSYWPSSQPSSPSLFARFSSS